MAINPLLLMASLKMGVDIEPDTDPSTVTHVREAGYYPVYTYQIEIEEGVWAEPRILSVEELPEFVEDMHGGFYNTVRLLEDGYPVFSCELI